MCILYFIYLIDILLHPNDFPLRALSAPLTYLYFPLNVKVILLLKEQ